MKGTALEQCAARTEGGRGVLWGLALALCGLALGLTAAAAPVAGILATAWAGVLFAQRRRLPALTAAIGMAGAWPAWPAAASSAGYWMALALALAAALAPGRMAAAWPHLPRAGLALSLLIAVAGTCLALLQVDMWAVPTLVLAGLSSAAAGAELARGRGSAAGETDPETLARNLLLGHMTTGMLHDLAQPLNVIAMANGNLDYIVNRAQIDPDSRQQLQERSRRIAGQTEEAAAILMLFRHFGRDNQTETEGEPVTVRAVLERALAATRSSLSHPGIGAEMVGEALDYPVHRERGRLEMIAAAALLTGFAAYRQPDAKRKGTIVLHAAGGRGEQVTIAMLCMDEDGEQLTPPPLSSTMRWLMGQFTHEGTVDFIAPRPEPVAAPLTIMLA